MRAVIIVALLAVAPGCARTKAVATPSQYSGLAATSLALSAMNESGDKVVDLTYQFGEGPVPTTVIELTQQKINDEDKPKDPAPKDNKVALAGGCRSGHCHVGGGHAHHHHGHHDHGHAHHHHGHHDHGHAHHHHGHHDHGHHGHVHRSYGHRRHVFRRGFFRRLFCRRRCR